MSDIARFVEKQKAEAEYAVEGKPIQFKLGFDRGFNAGWKSGLKERQVRIESLECAIREFLIVYDDEDLVGENFYSSLFTVSKKLRELVGE